MRGSARATSGDILTHATAVRLPHQLSHSLFFPSSCPPADTEGRNANYADLVNSYYNLATDFYEWGWGQSFHLANKLAGESFGASIARHEYYLTARLGVKPGDKVCLNPNPNPTLTLP